jgi:hypothetical protein
MDLFPRTEVAGVSMPRLIIGSNWFMGFSHTSAAQDKFIRDYQTRDRMADIITVFLNHGIDAIMSGPNQLLEEAICDAEDRAGQRVIRIYTPIFNITPGGLAENEPERMLDLCREYGATFCFPHQCVTDALLDRMTQSIRHIDVYTKMIRDRGMLPGLSTHMPESVIYADRTGADVVSYIQIYNAAGFLMQVEIDWINRVIKNAQKPVMTIKPLAAGRLMPIVGMTFVWNTIRPQDMVTIGTTTVDEAKEIIDLSLDLLAHQLPDNVLQKTRSKKSLD